MKFRIRFADQVVGAFLLLAVLGVAAILVLVGINQRWFAKDYTFRSRFDSAGGLSVGMPVMLKGFEIGQISRISLNDDNQVDVLFSVQDTFIDKVLPDSVLELTSSPIGLGVTLHFHPGVAGGPPLAEMDFIPSLDLPEGKALVEAGQGGASQGRRRHRLGHQQGQPDPRRGAVDARADPAGGADRGPRPAGQERSRGRDGGRPRGHAGQGERAHRRRERPGGGYRRPGRWRHGPRGHRGRRPWRHRRHHAGHARRALPRPRGDHRQPHARPPTASRTPGAW